MIDWKRIVEELLERVAWLERRVAELEARLGPLP